MRHCLCPQRRLWVHYWQRQAHSKLNNSKFSFCSLITHLQVFIECALLCVCVCFWGIYSHEQNLVFALWVQSSVILVLCIVTAIRIQRWEFYFLEKVRLVLCLERASISPSFNNQCCLLLPVLPSLTVTAIHPSFEFMETLVSASSLSSIFSGFCWHYFNPCPV